MTLAEWTQRLTEEYTAAGFVVKEYEGFPLVEVEASGGIQEKRRLLRFRSKTPAKRSIYAEGMLLLPVGSPPVGEN